MPATAIASARLTATTLGRKSADAYVASTFSSPTSGPPSSSSNCTTSSTRKRRPFRTDLLGRSQEDRVSGTPSFLRRLGLRCARSPKDGALGALPLATRSLSRDTSEHVGRSIRSSHEHLA